MKQIQILFTRRDEESLSGTLRESWASLVVVDGQVWETPQPPLKASIAACDSSIVMLWNRELTPSLPFILRRDGRYEGPSVGPVLQVVRSRPEEGVLRSGSISASSDVPSMLEFIEAVWRTLRKWGETKVRSINPSNGETINPRVPGYLLGPDAASWWSTQHDRRLKDRSTENYFAPAEQPVRGVRPT